MAGSVNKVILIGNLGKDPEIRVTQNGKEVAQLVLATSESWKDKASGERKEKTEWHKVVLFSEGLVNLAKNYLSKGSKVYLEGQLATRKWTNNAGQDQYSTEIVLQGFNATMTILESKKGEEMTFDEYQGHGMSNNAEAVKRTSGMTAPPSKSTFTAKSFTGKDFVDDEIPF